MSHIDLSIRDTAPRSIDALPPRMLAVDGEIDELIDLRPATGDRDRSRGVPWTPRPRLTWRQGADAVVAPGGYEIELTDADGDLWWASGWVETADSFAIVGRPLNPFARYSWRVRVRSGSGAVSGWAAATFETGPFELSDWDAGWVSVPRLARVAYPFRIDGDAVMARLYVTGQGRVRAAINSLVINGDSLDPSPTDFTRALYRCYDVTDTIAPGANELSFVLGGGEWLRTGRAPRLLAELRVWRADGSMTVVAADPSGRIDASEVVIEEPFYLERHDSAAVTRPSGDSLVVAEIAVGLPSSVASPPELVEPDRSPPVRAVEHFLPSRVGSPDGSRVYDVGTNIAGRAVLTLQAGVEPGTLITLIHGEHIGADGHIDTTNLTMPFDHGRLRQSLEHVAAGGAGERVEPWFSYYGFRYVEVRGIPAGLDVELVAYSVHTDLRPSGGMTTDSAIVNRLLSVAERTLLNNVHGVPEDCPTREQAAWTGDTASVAEYELAAFDSAGFLDKWIGDLQTSQQPDGQIPAIAPDIHVERMPAEPVWGAALHRMLVGHLRHYGDDRLVTRALPSLRRWADFQLSCRDEGGVVSESAISYGHDWLALEQTPPELLHTGSAIDCLEALAELEDYVGDEGAAATRRAQAEELRASARRRFWDPAGCVFGNGSQASYAVAIDAGILTGRDREVAARKLAQLVRDRGNRVAAGFGGTRSVVRALTATGASQVVFDALHQSAEPGVGAMLSSGPGTFWECWWIDPQNTGTGSLNHVGLGGPFAAWAWEGLAGVRPSSWGYRQVDIAPQFVSGVTRLDLHTSTVRGEIRVAYVIESGVVQLDIDVPPGVTARVSVPWSSDQVVESGHHRVTGVVQLDPVKTAPPEPVWHAPSVAPASEDVRDHRDLLVGATLRPGTPETVLGSVDQLICMPIPHAQPHGPVARVSRQAGVDLDLPHVIVDLPAPLDLTDTTFVFATIDGCESATTVAALPFLVLHFADGSSRRTVGRRWPAGWNRIAVDLDPADRSRLLTQLEVGTEFAAGTATEPGRLHSHTDDVVSMYLGEVGTSSGPRTW